MAIMDSGGFTGVFPGPAQASAADTNTRRTEMQMRLRKIQIGRRTVFRPPKVKKPQILGKNIGSAGRPYIAVHLRLRELPKSTSRKDAPEAA